MKKLTWLIFPAILLLADANPIHSQSRVAIEKTGDRFQLLRNGKPYAIKGVGGQADLELLVQMGGNSIRTWDSKNIEAVLDRAEKLGITVTVGFWLGHERHGFNYQDQNAVIGQMEGILGTVRRVRNHPAVLLWAVGNEAEGAGTNPAIWYATNHIAREIKKIDPNHPTMTVIAELGENELKIRNIERFCPDIDVIGINSYGGIHSVGKRFRRANSSKPYIVTEHGPLGPWECGKTEWKSPIEFSSGEKAKWYADGYREAVQKQDGICFGSYAFLWGHKQETTATWFGMLLADGKRLAAADAMSEAWTGRPVNNHCPRIDSLKLEKTSKLKPGETIQAVAEASDPDQDPIQYKWVLSSDSGVIGVGGDAQGAEQVVRNSVKAEGGKARLTVPDSGGAYRLFLYLYDDHGGAAVANVPFFVDGPVRQYPAALAKLPYTVYDEGNTQGRFIPSGFMGNTQAVAMDLECSEKPHEGKTCLKAEYKSANEWGGVLWQSPENDWDGKRPGGMNFKGATALEFWVRGKAGGEKVNFILGGVGGDNPYRDTAKAELPNVVLSQDWTKKTISLKGKELSRIKTAFGWSLAGQGKPVTFYVDNIRLVGE